MKCTISLCTAATTGTLSVVVIDTNDNGPVFVKSSLFAAVAEEAPFGTTITVVEVQIYQTVNSVKCLYTAYRLY